MNAPKCSDVKREGCTVGQVEYYYRRRVFSASSPLGGCCRLSMCVCRVPRTTPGWTESRDRGGTACWSRLPSRWSNWVAGCCGNHLGRNKQHGWQQSHLADTLTQFAVCSCSFCWCWYASSSHRPIAPPVESESSSHHCPTCRGQIATSCSLIITLSAIEQFLDPLRSCRDIFLSLSRYSSSCLALFPIFLITQCTAQPGRIAAIPCHHTLTSQSTNLLPPRNTSIPARQ